MSDAVQAHARPPGGMIAALRLVLGAAIGGASGMIAGLVIVHQAEKRDWAGNVDLARAIGQARGEEQTDAARAGLYALMFAGILIGLVVVIPAARYLGSRWIAIGLVVAGAAFAAWGLGYAPYADARLDDYTAGGLFGSAGGAEIALVYAAAALVYGLVAARVATVIADADFWTPKDNDIRAGLERLQEMGLVGSGISSLELAEKRAEQGDEPPGAQTADWRA